MWFIIGIIVGVLLIILVRGLLFKPQKQTQAAAEEIFFDSDKAVDSLCEMIACKTVSYSDASLEDNAEFERFVALLPKLFPKVFSVCEFSQLPDRALLLKWKGQNEGDATVLMAHYDVVPVDESGWEKPAFDGIVEDGVIWGRGALDTKVSLNSALNAAEHLIAEGFTPNNDIYFAFSGNEEVNGLGAPNIVDYFEQNNIKIGLVLDEGGAVVENVFPGVKAPCGLIGIAEKGMLNLEYKAASNGGHASSPKPNAPIDILCAACGNVLHYPFKAGVSAPVAEMFDTLGRHSNLLYRIIFANLKLFFPLLDAICKKSGGELNALVRTTTAFTQMYGSSAVNVIPNEASIVSNMRLSPDDTIDSAVDYIKKTVGNDNIKLRVVSGFNPSRVSRTDCEEYTKVANAVAATWKGAIVSPYLMVQCSDSRHYGRISDKVYRFSSLDLTSEERATIHANNERVRIDTLKRSVEFYIRLIKNC